MAGTAAGFNADGFRQAIRFVYTMAAPVPADEQLTFYFKPTVTRAPDSDSEGVPFNIGGPKSTVTQRPPVAVPCGIEQVPEGARADVDTPFGVLRSPWVKISLLDEDYEQVRDSAYILLGGEKYDYHHTEVPGGLFSVGLYTMIFVNENDL